MKVTRSFLAGIATTLCLAACGTAHDANSKLKETAALSDDGAQALGQVRLIEGEFEANKGSPECVALRVKLFAERQAVKASSEWSTIKSTNEFKVLNDHQNHFKEFGCNPENPDATQQCHDMQAQLESDAAALSRTPQWQTLGNNTHWHDLQEDFAKAKQINCL